VHSRLFSLLLIPFTSQQNTSISTKLILNLLEYYKTTNKNQHIQTKQAAPRNTAKMGAVVSCIRSLCQTIGSVLMAIVNGIASVLQAIVGGIAAFFDIIISCLTCGRSGGRRRRGGTTSHV